MGLSLIKRVSDDVKMPHLAVEISLRRQALQWDLQTTVSLGAPGVLSHVVQRFHRRTPWLSVGSAARHR